MGKPGAAKRAKASSEAKEGAKEGAKEASVVVSDRVQRPGKRANKGAFDLRVSWP